jgi:hypothetical protein
MDPNLKDPQTLEEMSSPSPSIVFHQMTSKPLIEEILAQSKTAFWLLVVTGMVWGSEEMWQKLGNVIIGIDKNGYPCIATAVSIAVSSPTMSSSSSTQLNAMHLNTTCTTSDIETETPSLTSTTSTPNTPNTIHPSPASETFSYSCSLLSYQMKKYLCRCWYILVRIIVTLSVGLILLSIATTSVYVSSSNWSKEIVLFYCSMFIQAITTLITTQLMMTRLQSKAPIYCLSAFHGNIIPLCSIFFVYTITLEALTLFHHDTYAFFIGFSNYTLLACLMFILIDIHSSTQLLDYLIIKLKSATSQHSTNKKTTALDTTTTKWEAASPLSLISIDPESNSRNQRALSVLPINLQDYEDIRLEIQQRVQESWYINTFAVTVAGLNLANLLIGAFTYLPTFNPYDATEIILQLSKEIVFLFIVFCYCAELNAKAVRFNDQLGNYLAWHQQPMHVWHYACLNPISFELGGYVVTWSRIAIQLASIGVGILLGFARRLLLGG